MRGEEERGEGTESTGLSILISDEVEVHFAGGSAVLSRKLAPSKAADLIAMLQDGWGMRRQLASSRCAGGALTS